jgi:hypothetical protein
MIFEKQNAVSENFDSLTNNIVSTMVSNLLSVLFTNAILGSSLQSANIEIINDKVSRLLENGRLLR